MPLNIDSMSPITDNSQQLIMKQLDRCIAELDEISKDVVDVKIQLAQLKVKSGVWGLIGGAVPIIIGVFVYLVQTYKHL